jgi:hypothetical protein
LTAPIPASWAKSTERNPKRWSGETCKWKPVLVVNLNPEKPLQTEINRPLEHDALIKKAA